MSLWGQIKNNTLSQPASLIFLSPTIEPLGFWEVLWAVGITNFMIKFLFMGIKCLILLLPFSLVTYRVQVSWVCRPITESMSRLSYGFLIIL